MSQGSLKNITRCLVIHYIYLEANLQLSYYLRKSAQGLIWSYSYQCLFSARHALKAFRVFLSVILYW